MKKKLYLITNYLDKIGIEHKVQISDESSNVIIPFASAMKLVISIFTKGTIGFYGQIRTYSAHFDGERTDLHDFITTLWSICLRVRGVASSTTLFELNGFTLIEGEFYLGYVVLKQPTKLGFVDDSDFEWLQQLSMDHKKLPISSMN